MTVQQQENQAPRKARDTLANRLRLIRAELGLSQRAACERTGISYGEWQSMEKGAQSRGLDQKVTKIAEGLGYDRDWLMWGGALSGPTGRWPADIRLESNAA